VDKLDVIAEQKKWATLKMHYHRSISQWSAEMGGNKCLVRFLQTAKIMLKDI